MERYDVLIAGAGVVGAAIAYSLARYELSVCLIDKEADVSCGASKANSGIVHAGFDARPGSLMARLNVEGCKLYPELCQRLDVPYINNGTLVLGFSDQDRAHLERLMERGVKNGVPGLELLNGERCAALEPCVSDEVQWALSAPSAGIISPYEMTIALAGNAVTNGVTILLGHAVRKVEAVEGGYAVKAGGRTVTARFVVNAAGAGAPALAALAGAGHFEQTLRRGEYCLLDKRQPGKPGGTLTRTLFQTPDKMGKGVLVTPTTDGNLLIGPTAVDTSDPGDTDTTREGQQQLLDAGLRSVPGLPVRDIINSFCGLRAIVGDDFHIETAPGQSGWINLTGICSPGLTAAPAIGIYVTEMLAENGLKLKEKAEYNPVRRRPPRFSELDDLQRGTLLKNPLYGRVICRCESVTEAEIVAAIHDVIPATTVDGVKRRVRAGMGRCQGGFCLPRILEIIARETGMSMDEVTKSGGASYILAGKTRS